MIVCCPVKTYVYNQPNSSFCANIVLRAFIAIDVLIRKEVVFNHPARELNAFTYQPYQTYALLPGWF